VVARTKIIIFDCVSIGIGSHTEIQIVGVWTSCLKSTLGQGLIKRNERYNRKKKQLNISIAECNWHIHSVRIEIIIHWCGNRWLSYRFDP